MHIVSTQQPADPASDEIPGTYLSAQTVESFLQADPIGKFLREDPAGRFLQGSLFGCPVELNLYTYVGNNPVNWIDPLGLKKGQRGAGAHYGCLWRCMKWAIPKKIGFWGAKKLALRYGLKAAAKWISGVGWAWFTGQTVYRTIKCSEAHLF